jgi:hypothetical protein
MRGRAGAAGWVRSWRPDPVLGSGDSRSARRRLRDLAVIKNQRRVAHGHAVLPRDDLNRGKFFAHHFFEAALAVYGRHAAGLVHQLGDFAFVVHQLGQASRGGLARAVV